MDFSKLEKLKKIKKLSYDELAEMIGMSKNGLNLAIKNKELKVSVLEKIANILGVSVSYFFEETSSHELNEPASEYRTRCKSCERYEDIIDTQRILIKTLLEKTNSEMNKKVS